MPKRHREKKTPSLPEIQQDEMGYFETFGIHELKEIERMGFYGLNTDADCVGVRADFGHDSDDQY